MPNVSKDPIEDKTKNTNENDGKVKEGKNTVRVHYTRSQKKLDN